MCLVIRNMVLKVSTMFFLLCVFLAENNLKLSFLGLQNSNLNFLAIKDDPETIALNDVLSSQVNDVLFKKKKQKKNKAKQNKYKKIHSLKTQDVRVFSKIQVCLVFIFKG